MGGGIIGAQPGVGGIFGGGAQMGGGSDLFGGLGGLGATLNAGVMFQEGPLSLPKEVRCIVLECAYVQLS